jgi:hypothetical protein
VALPAQQLVIIHVVHRIILIAAAARARLTAGFSAATAIA